MLSLGRLLLRRLGLHRAQTNGPFRVVVDRLPHPPTAEELRSLASNAGSGAAAALDQFALALIAIDKDGDRQLRQAAIDEVEQLGPRTWLALDVTARKSWWNAPAWSNAVRSTLAESEPTALGLVLASLHPDGNIREAAVARMAELEAKVVVAPLSVRCADWVQEVRDRARVAIEARLSARDGTALVAAAAIGLMMRERQEGTWLAEVVEDRLRNGTAAELDATLSAKDWRTRRAAYGAAIEGESLDLKQLLQAAARDSDMPIRTLCARAAVVRALSDSAATDLQPLLLSGTALVRGEAVAALAQAGDTGPASSALLDRSPIVRWTAQVALRRAGISPVDRYRELVLADPPPPAAIAGLGETGDGSDVTVISRWLSHPAASGRAQAVRALRKLGGATPERVAQMLTDDSAAVTRQVANALIGHAREVDGDFLSELIREDHPRHVRVAAYRLLRQRDVWTRLSADLRFVDDDEIAVKTRARADLDAWLKRDAAITYSRPEGATAEELRRLLDDGERFLNPKTAKDLRFHLGLQKGM
jgi:hypothetical protein